MAELTIRPEEIRDALARFVEAYEPEAASKEEVGTVIECGDGIARVEACPPPWPMSCWSSRTARAASR